MPVNGPHTTSRREGFTLSELLVSAFLMAMLLAIVTGGFRIGINAAKGCGKQVDYTAKGRAAAQKLSRYIEAGQVCAIAPTSNGVDVLVGLVSSRIAYVADYDGKASTTNDGALVYYPSSLSTNGGVIICTPVSPIAGTAMFRINPAAPSSVSFVFTLGDRTNATDASRGSISGTGYQGIDVRISATPRNMKRWYSYE